MRDTNPLPRGPRPAVAWTLAALLALWPVAGRALDDANALRSNIITENIANNIASDKTRTSGKLILSKSIWIGGGMPPKDDKAASTESTASAGSPESTASAGSTASAKATPAPATGGGGNIRAGTARVTREAALYITIGGEATGSVGAGTQVSVIGANMGGGSWARVAVGDSLFYIEQSALAQ